jgi:hypothetical protein
MAEGSMSKLNITPEKYVRENKYFCFLCGINLPDAKRRARITSSVAKLLSDILECELDTIDVTGYLCNDDCYKKTSTENIVGGTVCNIKRQTITCCM